MSLIHPTITDARGRPFRLTRYEALLPGSSDPMRHERLMKAGYADAPFQIRDGLAWPLYLIVAGWTLILIVAGLAIVLWLGLPMWAMVIVLVFVVVVAHAVIITCTRRLAAREIARVYLRARYCPSCGYDLENALPEQDGATPCSECGAFWSPPQS